MSAGPELGLDVELRRHIANYLADRGDVIVADTVATFPITAETRRLDADYCVRLGSLATRLLGDAIVGGALDSRGPGISELAALMDDREVGPETLFTFIHIVMSTSVDELSLDKRVGLNTKSWPQAAQIVRRAAFDLLGAWTARLVYSPQHTAIQDPLTTLHTRPVLDAVLPKECCRAERPEHWLSLLLIDIDNLSAINKAHGYGVGDRILERMGILLRTYFRKHDWVVRYGEDTIAVLLLQTTPDDAMTLAERTRAMVEERLTFRDYRTDRRAVVTVSVAAISARALEGEPIDHMKFTAEAEAALKRAKLAGRNRVERVEMLPRLISIAEASAILNTDIDGVDKLVADGRLDPVRAGRHVRLERQAVEALANSAK
jgi:diguanylate cyclase (GGDEF)-like protein/excisionase family DNA binding protein